MLKEFFSIPIYPDNENYRRELFKDTKITERSCLLDGHFCKYPVIFLSLKVWRYLLLQTVLLICSFFVLSYQDCDVVTWSDMQATICKKLADLYKEHEYIYDKLDKYERLNFDQIRFGKLQLEITKDALVDLSNYLRTYHRRRCIVLIDEYDHPMEIAYQHQYYEEARRFFSSLFEALLKVSICYSCLP
jgi:hypothetical protein